MWGVGEALYLWVVGDVSTRFKVGLEVTYLLIDGCGIATLCPESSDLCTGTRVCGRWMCSELEEWLSKR